MGKIIKWIFLVIIGLGIFGAVFINDEDDGSKARLEMLLKVKKIV